MKKISLAILIVTLMVGSIFASGAVIKINNKPNIESSNIDACTVFSSSYDGYLRCGGLNNEYNAVHDSSLSGKIDTTSSFIQFGQKDLGTGSSNSWYIDRGFLYFDTSSIPSDAAINSVIFNFVISGVYSQYIERELKIFYDPSGIHPHLDLEDRDYDLDHYIDTNAGSFIFDSMDAYSWSWDSAAFNSINRDGFTKIMITTKNDWDGDSNAYWAWSQMWSGDYTDGDDPNHEPYLTIEYQTGNSPPDTPTATSGPAELEVNEEGVYTTSSNDPNGDDIRFGWDWNGDSVTDEWSDWMASGSYDHRSHSWDAEGTYNVMVKAEDSNGAQSDFSPAKIVTIIESVDSPDMYFVQVSDTHVLYNSDGTSKTQENFKKVIHQINSFKEKPAFVVITGDLVEWGGDGESGAQNYQSFIDCLYRKDEQLYLDSGYLIPVYTIPGNHGYRNVNLLDTSLVNYHQYIDSRDRYIVDYEDLSLFFLDSGHDYFDDPFDWYRVLGDGLYQDDIEWLESSLSTCESQHKIVLMHHPAVNDRDIFGKMMSVIARNREEFVELCDNYEVDLVLAGHTHISAIYDSVENSYGDSSEPLNCSSYSTLYVQTSDCKENRSYRNISIIGDDIWLHPDEVVRKSRTITNVLESAQLPILKYFFKSLKKVFLKAAGGN